MLQGTSQPELHVQPHRRNTSSNTLLQRARKGAL